MKKLGILSNYWQTFSIDWETKQSYIDAFHLFKKWWIDTKRISIHSFDSQRKIFTNYVDLNENQDFTIIQSEYRPEVIWNRSRDGSIFSYNIIQNLWIPVFPSFNMTAIASDKYEISLFLKQYQPQTLLVRDFYTNPHFQESLSDMLILKPIRSNSWKGIIRITKKELLTKEDEFKSTWSLYIIQEFIDFSRGIPNITQWMHDLRIMFIWKELVIWTLRTPAIWEFKSNVGLWWSEDLLLLEDIPEELLKIASEILSQIPVWEISIGSIDFWYHLASGKWYVFEINFSPWLFLASKNLEDRKKFQSIYFPKLIDFIHTHF